MRMNIKILLWSLLSLFISCEKPVPEEPKMQDQEEAFHLLWASRLDPNKDVVTLNNGQHYEDWYIFSSDLGDPSSIFAFNKETGEKEWQLEFAEFETSVIDYSLVQDQYYVADTGREIFVIDLGLRQVVWRYNYKDEDLVPYKGPEYHNGKIYVEVAKYFQEPNMEIHLFAFDLLTGEREIAYTALTDSTGRKTISPPVFWTDEETSQELMIFSQRPNSEQPPEYLRQDLIAIDVETGEKVWHTKDVVTQFASNGQHPPAIFEDIVIVGAHSSIFAFNARTGEQIWKNGLSYPWAVWSSTNHLIHDGRLYVNNSQDDVTCYNARTGSLIWNNTMGGANCSDNMVYYENEDLLVFTSWGYGSVMILDALTGETIHREHRFENSQYNNDVVYDKERDMFFTSTYKHAVAFKVSRI